MQPPSEFNFDDAQSWSDWIVRFERYLSITNSSNKSNKEKVDLLCYTMGARIEALLKQLLPDSADRNYEKIKQCLTEHFCPNQNRNLVRDRYNFNTHFQSKESVSDYASALIREAEACNFGSMQDELVRDRLIVGMKDNILRKHLLDNPDLKPADAIKLALKKKEVESERNIMLNRRPSECRSMIEPAERNVALEENDESDDCYVVEPPVSGSGGEQSSSTISAQAQNNKNTPPLVGIADIPTVQQPVNRHENSTSENQASSEDISNNDNILNQPTPKNINKKLASQNGASKKGSKKKAASEDSEDGEEEEEEEEQEEAFEEEEKKKPAKRGPKKAAPKRKKGSSDDEESASDEDTSDEEYRPKQKPKSKGKSGKKNRESKNRFDDSDDDRFKTKKAPAKRSIRDAYTKPKKLSPELAAMVGCKEMCRAEVMKKVWSIIKEQNLYDPSNKQFAICNEELLKVIGKKRFRTISMMKYLKNHFKD